jgi:hypothetical protein
MDEKDKCKSCKGQKVVKDRKVLEVNIEKGMKKKFGKKVLSGAMTVDEARSRMGRKRAQKMLEWQTEQQLAKGEITREDALKALGFAPDAEVTVAKSTEPEVIKGEIVTPAQAPVISPEIIKSAIADAIAPLVAKVAEQQKMLDLIADQPDPKTQPWAGIALKNMRPAGVVEKAEVAERTQQMIKRQLNHTWRTSESAHEREAAWTELAKFGNPE